MLREVELAEPGGSGRTAGGSGAVDGEEVEVEDDDVRLLPAALEMPLGAGGQSSSFWSNLRASLREEPLLMQTLVGVIVGVCIGSIARACGPSPTTVELVAFPGELFMRVLRGLVIPLVSVSMVCGVLSLFDKTNGTNGGAKQVAFRLMLAYLVTTLVACAIGLLVVHAVRPGDGVSLQMGRDCGAKVERTVPSPATQRSGGALASVLTTARAAVPSNVFNALNEGNVLGIITASLFFGTAIASVDGNSTKDVVTLFHALDKIIQLCVKWATQLMPIGVSSIVAGRISGTCDPTQMLSALGKYVFCILLGLGAHAAVALPGMYVVATSTRFSRVFFSTRNRGGARNAGNASQHPPPPSFLQVIKAGVPSFATAFAVDSSSVALPKTIACAMSLGVPESLAKFSLPLGATVNMNGTALYEGTYFVSQIQSTVCPYKTDTFFYLSQR